MDSGQVTLIFRQLEKKWTDEYALNILAALATNSNFSHVEVAIGDDAGTEGQMSNVLRIFNDAVGVELAQRTGKSPNFQYLQLGCSKQAERAMLQFAYEQRGKPFSMAAMFRSVTWPRKTNLRSYFCAELVAATLQAGNLMSADSNPGAATPRSLYDMYSAHAAATGNPCTMRSIMTERDSPEEHRSFYRSRLFGGVYSGASAPAYVGSNIGSGRPSSGEYLSLSTTKSSGSFRPLQLHLAPGIEPLGMPLRTGSCSRAELQIRKAVKDMHGGGTGDAHFGGAMLMPASNERRVTGRSVR